MIVSTHVSLNGLAGLNEEVAKALAAHKGNLSLDGLISLSDAAACEIAKLKGSLGLNGLNSLNEEVAKALATHKGDLLLTLDLGGLNSIEFQTPMLVLSKGQSSRIRKTFQTI